MGKTKGVLYLEGGGEETWNYKNSQEKYSLTDEKWTECGRFRFVNVFIGHKFLKREYDGRYKEIKL